MNFFEVPISVIMETLSMSHHPELEGQLEIRDSSIASLRRMLEQKDALLMATSDKLCDSERKRTEMEDALLSLTKESGPEAEEVDNFVASSSRAAQMEAENSDLRLRMAALATKVQEFCNQFRNEANFNSLEAVQRLEVSVGPANSILVPQQLTDENVHLQIRMELEHERRLRVQAALDDSEKRHVGLKHDLENKSRDFDELEKRLSNMRDKYEHKIKQVCKCS
jgi:chromosome segregation ATPase